MSSTSSDSEITFYSEDSEIYFIAEDTGREVGFKTMTTKLIYWQSFVDHPAAQRLANLEWTPKYEEVDAGKEGQTRRQRRQRYVEVSG